MLNLYAIIIIKYSNYLLLGFYALIFLFFPHQNAAKKREQDQTEGDNAAPPRKVPRRDSWEVNEDS